MNPFETYFEKNIEQDREIQRLLEMNPVETIFEKDFEQVFKKYGGDQWQDLRQEVAIIVFEYDKTRVEQIANRSPNDFRFWISRLCLNQVTSHGRFLYKMKQFSKVISFVYFDDFKGFTDKSEEYDFDLDHTITMIEQKLKTLEWYEQRIFSLYLENGSVRKVATKVGIPTTSIFYTLKKVKECLKQSLS